ncbi:MAG: Ig-like domain-containing protein [Cytophagales bacterium]|nr:Ig-like domain-containing protein [Cytophagales bacterium]
MLRHLKINSLAVCILAGLLLCAGIVSAQMTFTSVPSANSTSIGVTSNIELDFSADIDLGTVHSNTTNTDNVFDDNIKIVGSQSGQFRGVFSVGADNSIVVFNPLHQL